MKILLILVCSCLCSVGMFAQDDCMWRSIQGTVTDSGEKILSNAEVTLVLEKKYGKFKKTVTSDSAGKYIFSCLPPGTFIITASVSVNGENKMSLPVQVNVFLGKETPQL